MIKKNYVDSLILAFNTCKELIVGGKSEIAIDFENKYNKKNLICNIPAFNNIPNIKIYCISKEKYLHSEYIHLSGVNVLFFIAALYLRVEKKNNGNYYEYTNNENEMLKIKERTDILKQVSFIFEKDTKGFWYYPISELKNTSLFIFDIKKMDGDTTTNN